MTQGGTNQVQEPDSGGGGHRSRERLSPSNFLLVAAAVLTVVIAALVAVLTTVSGWTITLVAAGIVLFLAVFFTGLTESKWFPRAAAVALVIILIVAGFLIPRIHERHEIPAPVLSFVKNSPATVPWCNVFNLTVQGPIPHGYQILVFDASTDSQFKVTGSYDYDGTARPVSRIPGEWVTPFVYPGSRYKEDDKGNKILKNGKPIVNVGYPVTVFAWLVPDSDAQIIEGVEAAAWGLKSLPLNVLSAAHLDVIRNHDIRQCARPR
jgi:hypothetical protein